MKITFLGTGTSTGIPTIGVDRPVCKSEDSKDIRLRSSILINVEQKNILIDCSPDFRQQMLKNNFSKIDAILFTHEHSDHTAGLDDVRPISFKYGKIPLFGKKRVLKKLEKRFDYLFDDSSGYTGSPHVYSNNVKKNTDFKIDDLVFKPISYMHHKLQVFGYRLFNFAYITDLKTINDNELKKLMNLDCLVLNALRHKEHYSHINLNQALEIVEILKPKTTYLTHIAPDMGFHAETEKLLPENVYLAYDGLQVVID
jgi:phosphoribosyl 1,2-cyclic phosphate phosphodiesterase